MPGLVTVFLFQFVAIWNNFLLPFIMLGDDEQVPGHGRALHAAQPGQHQPALYTLVITGALLSIIPLIVLFLTLQRYWRVDLLVRGGEGVSASGVLARHGTVSVREPRRGTASPRRPRRSTTSPRWPASRGGTVSRVLNGGHNVSPTRARTRSTGAIRKTGYVVNQHARSLVTAALDSVAFLLTEPQERLFEDPNFNVLLRGCTQALAEHDITAAADDVAGTRGARSASALHHGRPRRRRPAGLAPTPATRCWTSCAGRDPSWPAAGRSGTSGTSAYVAADDRDGARQMVAVPVAAGRRRIAMITGPLDTPGGVDRLAGYREVLAAHGLPATP